MSRAGKWSRASMENDRFFLRLVKRGWLKVYRSGRVLNTLTGNWLGEKPLKRANSYHRVSWNDVEAGRIRNIYLQRLIWLAFKGRIPEGYQVNHDDGNKSNNRLSNFSLLTNAQNTADGYKRNDNSARQGVNHTLSKLTDKQVRFIRRKAGTITQRQLASRFGVTQKVVSNVIHHRSYANVV